MWIWPPVQGLPSASPAMYVAPCLLESYEDGFESILWFCIFVNVQQSSLDIAGPDVGRSTVFLGWI